MINDGINKKSPITSILMAGQSNMAGRGNLGEVEPIVNNKCYMLRMGRWQCMHEPINVDRPIFQVEYFSGTSLGASFADEFAKYYNKEIGLVPCADGGTKIHQWQPGEVLFDHAVMMTRLAMRTSSFGGIIWHQGESDCHTFDGAAYERMFMNTMNGFIKEFGEDIPIVIGEISLDITEKWNVECLGEMNDLLHRLSKRLPRCTVVGVQGLELKPDGIHFSSKSLRILGRRYFEKYKELCEK